MTHPLDGCWAKVERAKENIENLNREITAFLNRDPKPYKVVGQHQNDGREYAFIVSGDPYVPPRFSVLAGEIVHHLRSSLDHLVHALIVRNGGTPANNNQFPICTTREKFERACNSGAIQGVIRSAKKIIRSVQPYTSATPDDTILTVIHDYDVLDKHRLLVVVATVAQLGREIKMGTDKEIIAAMGESYQPPAIVKFGDPSRRKITKEGVEVFTISFAKPAPDFKAKANIVSNIAFEKCGRVKLVPVILALTNFLRGTVHTIDQFENEFSNTPRSLKQYLNI